MAKDTENLSDKEVLNGLQRLGNLVKEFIDGDSRLTNLSANYISPNVFDTFPIGIKISPKEDCNDPELISTVIGCLDVPVMMEKGFALDSYKYPDTTNVYIYCHERFNLENLVKRHFLVCNDVHESFKISD